MNKDRIIFLLLVILPESNKHILQNPKAFINELQIRDLKWTMDILCFLSYYRPITREM